MVGGSRSTIPETGMKPFVGQLVLYRSPHNSARMPGVVVEVLGGTLVDLRNFRDLSYIEAVELKGIAPEKEGVFGYWEPLPEEVD